MWVVALATKPYTARKLTNILALIQGMGAHVRACLENAEAVPVGEVREVHCHCHSIGEDTQP